MSEPRPLHVLLVIESAGGGSGRHVLDLAAGLVRAGHRVALAYSPVRADAWFVDEARALDGVTLHRLEMARAPGPGDLAVAWRLRKLLRTAGPFDIVHGHSAKAGALVRLAGFLTRSRRVYTPHAFITLDPDLGWAKRQAYTWAERILGRLGATTICVSDEERQHAMDLGLSAPSRVHVVHNAQAPLPPADRDAPRRDWGLAPDAVCIGFVGRLSGQKAVNRLIEAFAGVCRTEPHARLVVIGSGPLQPAHEAQVRELGIGDRVLFHGPGPGPRLMAGFDVFAMTSRYEGFPYVYLEALARGLPVVTTPVGGSSAVVEDGVNGFIVAHDDPEGFAAALTKLVREDDLREAMSRASLERSERFSIEAMIAATVAVYGGAMTRAGDA